MADSVPTTAAPYCPASPLSTPPASLAVLRILQSAMSPLYSGAVTKRPLTRTRTYSLPLQPLRRSLTGMPVLSSRPLRAIRLDGESPLVRARWLVRIRAWSSTVWKKPDVLASPNPGRNPASLGSSANSASMRRTSWAVSTMDSATFGLDGPKSMVRS